MDPARDSGFCFASKCPADKMELVAHKIPDSVWLCGPARLYHQDCFQGSLAKVPAGQGHFRTHRARAKRAPGRQAVHLRSGEGASVAQGGPGTWRWASCAACFCLFWSWTEQLGMVPGERLVGQSVFRDRRDLPVKTATKFKVLLLLKILT